MPSRLESHFAEPLKAGRKLLIPFLTAGYPDEGRFIEAARAVAAAGADALEIGIPFSDPLADGPTIQRTSQRALDQGTTMGGVLDSIARHGSSIGIPIVLMTYMNPIQAMGQEEFCRRAAQSGVDGVLVSDLPPEEMPEFHGRLRSSGLDRILLVAPTTREDRLPVLIRHASGFIYCVTRTGVTGAGGAFADILGETIRRIRTLTSLPVVAGFGIRSAADVSVLRDLVDGVVIGAKLLEIMGEDDPPDTIREGIAAFLAPIRKSLSAA